jgi:hypothetical protein
LNCVDVSCVTVVANYVVVVVGCNAFDVEFLDVFQFCVMQCICGCSGLSGIQKFPRGWREVYRVLEVRFEPCPKKTRPVLDRFHDSGMEMLGVQLRKY